MFFVILLTFIKSRSFSTHCYLLSYQQQEHLLFIKIIKAKRSRKNHNVLWYFCAEVEHIGCSLVVWGSMGENKTSREYHCVQNASLPPISHKHHYGHYGYTAPARVNHLDTNLLQCIVDFISALDNPLSVWTSQINSDSITNWLTVKLGFFVMDI